ncbi:hypothetical protein MATL_G00032790 [Megalops atlanticus]|uniref:Uncharacterized protein n=1 Tax=Megalops atlanticus TaxID=7932 RepID=A0A9D3QDF7_MEGAT|nr:hypothetical protein MATL_G00032790 [Megalops atlanticus]
MASSPFFLEEDLTCPVCSDIFRDPVILRCSHSFCRDCLQRRWGSKPPECPVCQRKSSAELQRNLALRAVCDRLLKRRQGGPRAAPGQGAFCGFHSEALRFFCSDDDTPICADCLAEAHMDHKLCPLDKAVPQRKEKLKTALTPLQEKLEAFNKAKQTFDQTAEFIKIQTQQTEGQIKEEFEKLHQFLRQEEATRIAALREEEEQKSQMLKERIEKMMRQISCLTNTIRVTEQEMKADDISFLQNYKDSMRRAQYKVIDPEVMSGALIDVAKHLGNLKYRVWENMLGIVLYSE